MSYRYGGWAPYVSVAERRRRAERAVAKMRKAGQGVSPVAIIGRKIATTFWGRAWCDNMESYHDYETRLPRGRSYVRNGAVVDLQIAPGRISALVSGSDLYRVGITIKAAVPAQWRAICADCAGGIDSLVELLQGRLSKSVMERLCRQEGLFPRPSDIRFTCTCPDHALMCKHVAAVLYGVGARLDAKPELLFRLRAVDEADLVAGIDATLPLAKAGATGRVLEVDDMSALFGLDMAEAATIEAKAPDRRKRTIGLAPKPDAVPPTKAQDRAISVAKRTSGAIRSAADPQSKSRKASVVAMASKASAPTPGGSGEATRGAANTRPSRPDASRNARPVAHGRKPSGETPRTGVSKMQDKSGRQQQGSPAGEVERPAGRAPGRRLIPKVAVTSTAPAQSPRGRG